MLRSRFVFALSLVANVLLIDSAAEAADAKPAFSSTVVTPKTPGHAVEIDVELKGARDIYLVATDGGNGFGCDWADWAEPRLIGATNERKLTELRWSSASAGFGEVRVNQNSGGGPLKINGKRVSYGIGTHANSVIHYKLPAGFERFKARAGLDNGGTDQGGCGEGASVKFFVYFEKPPAAVLQASKNAPSGGVDLDEALDGLDTADGLKTTVFAGEPMMLSPTNIDVDHAGRVWVCEVVNYRGFRNKHPVREKGDRILVLEDTDADGKADNSTVFYQGRDIDSAHGVCVLGTPDGKHTRAIVSAGESVFVFTDEDGDLTSDRKEVLFTGIDGTQHDHGIHSFLFGPDGKLYFNFGNAGKHIKDKQGRPIVDLAGNTVDDSRKPYQEGMVFRCNLDGSEFETLGWNFRNNWELAVDSFGTIWQSDNDDDGNRGVRVNYVMEYGNYGYKDEFTGAGWKDPRTGMHDEIPKRHWHLNDPGVVPNLLQTGAGSPTGILVYEGALLPKVYQGNLIHCDAGPNIVRAYLTEPDGAGYKAEVKNILEGVTDKWFRPSDVCTAPDGSLIVADWYDPGVGGHAMGDVQRGRLFRVAPPAAAKYETPQLDFSSVDGSIEALKSPNVATRYIAWTALHKMGLKAEPQLLEMFNDDNDPRMQARALWLLGKIEGRGPEYVKTAIRRDDADLRIVGVRLARQLKMDVAPVVETLVNDPSPAVRRECLIALRGGITRQAPKLWAQLALQHDGQDRWYLEALGVAADGRWNACLTAWLDRVGNDWNTPAGRDILWRARTPDAIPFLAKIILDDKTDAKERPRYFRAFDFHNSDRSADRNLKTQTLIELATTDANGRPEVAALALKLLGKSGGANTPELKSALNKALAGAKGTERYLQLVGDFNLSDRYDEVLAMAQSKPDEQLGVEAVRLLLDKGRRREIRDALQSNDVLKGQATAKALGSAKDARAEKLLLPVMRDERNPAALRREAARSLAQTRNGALALVTLAESNNLDETLKPAAAAALHVAEWQDVKSRAEKLFPLPASRDQKPLPPLAELLTRKGNTAKGKLVFNTVGTCAKCHVVDKVGKEVGPDLSEIGGKLSRQAMYESILYPSAGVSHNYETWVIVTEAGNQVNGVITSRTPEEVAIKSADAIVRKFKTSEIDLMKKQEISMMPADLNKVLSAEDLVDVVEYMLTLKKKAKQAAAQ